MWAPGDLFHRGCGQSVCGDFGFVEKSSRSHGYFSEFALDCYVSCSLFSLFQKLPSALLTSDEFFFPSSSSYSSDALTFETEHRLDPVFDSPRMSRRSLRLVTTACATEDGQAGDAHSCASSTASLKDRAAR